MPQCAVPDCDQPAVVEVILYDLYPDGVRPGDEMFWERDVTCPFLCSRHLRENEASAEGVREPRGYVEYKYTNRNGAQGFSIYYPLSASQ